jgi:hypothetical protein
VTQVVEESAPRWRRWSQRAKQPNLPPLRDDEIDKSRAPRRNDFALAVLLALPIAVSQFWVSAYTLDFAHSVPGVVVRYTFDLQLGLVWALLLGFSGGAISYGLNRLILPTARRRRGERMTRRAKAGIVAFEGGFLGLLTFWRVDAVTQSGSLLPIELAFMVGTVGALVTAATLKLWIDVPPYDERFRPGAA